MKIRQCKLFAQNGPRIRSSLIQILEKDVHNPQMTFLSHRMHYIQLNLVSDIIIPEQLSRLQMVNFHEAICWISETHRKQKSCHT